MNIIELIHELNEFESSDEIAEFLMWKGIKGVPEQQYSCPISNWVKCNSAQGSTVSTEEGSITVSGEIDQDFYTSEAVDDFIYNFDMGKYPDLISSEGLF